MKQADFRTAASAALQIRLASAILLFLAAATLPYLWLIGHFGYDDILRANPPR
ncbi:MAG: hypothetical protein H7Z19_18595 [Chitinophagaceae bacterium]|nr:hypothetical protein [Rubrivivax sp.]